MREAISPLALFTFHGVGYFADLTVPIVSCPVVADYHPSVAVKFSLFLVIVFTDMYM
jgi:hypothetical protein